MILNFPLRIRKSQGKFLKFFLRLEQYAEYTPRQMLADVSLLHWITKVTDRPACKGFYFTAEKPLQHPDWELELSTRRTPHSVPLYLPGGNELFRTFVGYPRANREFKGLLLDAYINAWRAKNLPAPN
jgi:hypothetical protein